MYQSSHDVALAFLCWTVANKETSVSRVSGSHSDGIYPSKRVRTHSDTGETPTCSLCSHLPRWWWLAICHLSSPSAERR